ncbi:MAG TPA: flagellar biosynthetic protein FliR, partial [Stellaceae bacterium]|nr:flagellar biosynthetic protein FliR [Stellaceae bacterium]
SFKIGVEMAAPFMIVGTIFYVGVGLISRLTPQLQILFVIQPLQIVAGLFAFGLLLAAGLQWFLERFAAEFIALTGS